MKGDSALPTPTGNGRGAERVSCTANSMDDEAWGGKNYRSDAIPPQTRNSSNMLRRVLSLWNAWAWKPKLPNHGRRPVAIELQGDGVESTLQ